MGEKQRTTGELQREALLYQPRNGCDRLSARDGANMESYCGDYREFLDVGKTERECVTEAVRLVEAKSFELFIRGMAVSPGDRLYRTSQGKALMLAVVGTRPLNESVSIGVAHIGSPRLDLKPDPPHEDTELAFLRTHYYGDVRKHQWMTIPPELRGVATLKSGSTVAVSIGGAPEDPQFTIDDLLPHLDVEQSKKPLDEAIPDEGLNLLIGGRPLKNDEGSNWVRLTVMDYLNQKCHIMEGDFISAELEMVSVFKAADTGLDHSLIGACDHDDRACGFARLAAPLALGIPGKTTVCMLADKEEIDSTGVGGTKSTAFDIFVSNLCDAQRVLPKACCEESLCLSTDTIATYGPNFVEVYGERSSARVNYGTGLCKYTSSRGESGASDTFTEVAVYIRGVLDETGVVWRMAELSKVDAGGNGTVVCYVAERNVGTIDAGIPVPSMYVSFETVDKLDCHMTYKGIKAFYER